MQKLRSNPKPRRVGLVSSHEPTRADCLPRKIPASMRACMDALSGDRVVLFKTVMVRHQPQARNEHPNPSMPTGKIGEYGENWVRFRDPMPGTATAHRLPTGMIRGIGEDWVRFCVRQSPAGEDHLALPTGRIGGNGEDWVRLSRPRWRLARLLFGSSGDALRRGARLRPRVVPCMMGRWGSRFDRGR